MVAERTEIVFRLTKTAIEGKLDQARFLLRKSAERQGRFDPDGDRGHDPVVAQEIATRQALEQEEAELHRILAAINILNVAAFQGEQVVSIGSAVAVSLRFSDGGEDTMRVTVGTELDRRFLGDSALGCLGAGELLISDRSPLALAILGRKPGDRFEYDTGKTTASGNIISIDASPLLGVN